MINGIGLIKRGWNREFLMFSPRSRSGVLSPWSITPARSSEWGGVHGLGYQRLQKLYSDCKRSSKQAQSNYFKKEKGQNAVCLKWGGGQPSRPTEAPDQASERSRDNTDPLKPLRPAAQATGELPVAELFSHQGTGAQRLAPAWSCVATTWQDPGWHLDPPAPSSGPGLQEGPCAVRGVGSAPVHGWEVAQRGQTRLHHSLERCARVLARAFSSPLLTRTP